jgi:hypothetical protein
MSDVWRRLSREFQILAKHLGGAHDETSHGNRAAAAAVANSSRSWKKFASNLDRLRGAFGERGETKIEQGAVERIKNEVNSSLGDFEKSVGRLERQIFKHPDKAARINLIRGTKEIRRELFQLRQDWRKGALPQVFAKTRVIEHAIEGNDRTIAASR